MLILSLHAWNELFQDACQCIETSQCPEDKMDFTFGKSCQLGTVRCCHHIVKAVLEPLPVPLEPLPVIPYTFTSTSGPPKEEEQRPLLLNEKQELQKETILEPLPKEPLTFTSTAATPKNIPIEMKSSPPEIITKEWRPIVLLEEVTSISLHKRRIKDC